MRIAFFSPLPPQRSGIAEYSGKLLPYLGQLAEVTLFTDEVTKVDPAFQQEFSVRELHSFSGPLREGFDICLFQMGNNIHYHEGIYRTLRRHPGVVVLHDLNLHSFISEYAIRSGQPAAYIREMGYAYGQEGLHHVRRAQQGAYTYDVQRYPLYERVINLSLGAIVHSQYAQRTMHGRCPHTPIAHINQPVPLAKQLPSPAAAKASLDLGPDDLLLGSFGYVAPAKRVEVVIRALAELRGRFAQVHYALVGKVIDEYVLEPLLDELNLEDKVRLVGYADRETYRTYLAATDIGINLRYPTLGETSATLLDLMAAAKPILVSNVDAFVELPESACAKVDVGPAEGAQVRALLEGLITQRELRQQLGDNAAAYIRDACDPVTVAQQYVNFISGILDVSGAAGTMEESAWQMSST